MGHITAVHDHGLHDLRSFLATPHAERRHRHGCCDYAAFPLISMWKARPRGRRDLHLRRVDLLPSISSSRSSRPARPFRAVMLRRHPAVRHAAGVTSRLGRVPGFRVTPPKKAARSASAAPSTAGSSKVRAPMRRGHGEPRQATRGRLDPPQPDPRGPREGAGLTVPET